MLAFLGDPPLGEQTTGLGLGCGLLEGPRDIFGLVASRLLQQVPVHHGSAMKAQGGNPAGTKASVFRISLLTIFDASQ